MKLAVVGLAPVRFVSCSCLWEFFQEEKYFSSVATYIEIGICRKKESLQLIQNLINCIEQSKSLWKAKNLPPRLFRRKKYVEQGCQIFFGTRYQNLKKCTKWTQTIVVVISGHKISPIAIKYLYQYFLNQGPTKFTQIEIVVFKINHLATLM
jgi:hypothetical protein